MIRLILLSLAAALEAATTGRRPSPRVTKEDADRAEAQAFGLTVEEWREIQARGERR